MTDLEGFRKVLNSLNKEDLVDVLADSYISSSGKKEKLVENILKNSTFLERIIKETVRESSKDALIEMCEHLSIESNASAPELKQQILQKLDETVGNKDLQNQIKFLNVALSFADLGTDDLADVLDDYDLPISGKKSDLIELIAKNDSVMEEIFSLCKDNSGKDEIKDCCEELGIKSDGVRKDLETRIEDYLFKKEKNVSNNIESETNDRKKRNISKNKKDNYDYDREFLEIIDTIRSELEPEPCRDEKELQGNLKTFLTTKYPEKSVEREIQAYTASDTSKGKIDFLIDNKYVIELKLAKNNHTLQSFLGQLLGYQKIYPQIAALLLFDDTKMNEKQIQHYVGEYNEYGIPSIVLYGRITKTPRRRFVGAMDAD